MSVLVFLSNRLSDHPENRIIVENGDIRFYFSSKDEVVEWMETVHRVCICTACGWAKSHGMRCECQQEKSEDSSSTRLTLD
jgi:hypothetical protein